MYSLRIKLWLFLAISFLFGSFSPAPGQVCYDIKTYNIIISGTSNLHDWDAQVMNLSGWVKFNGETITEVSISIDAKSLKSSKGSIMDAKMQNALNTSRFPKITYVMVSSKSISEVNGLSRVSSTGNLTVSEVTKRITVVSNLKTLQDNSIEVTGGFDVLMTDFGIEPPSALFGTLKTANKVMVNYKLILQKRHS